jgi:Tfp pilus assembly protein PilN
MIKINLLQQRRGRARRGRAGGGPTAPVVLILVIGVLAVGAIGLFAVHMPLAGRVDSLESKNKELTAENKALEKETKNSRSIRAAFESELARQQATQRLILSRVSPAWLMNELSSILTPGKQPQLTPAMQAELKNNPNRPWQDGWDPKHVWISKFEEKGGTFTMKGGAQSKGDVIELGLRMSASMFFDDVTPTATDDVQDKDSGLTYHRFELEGKVRY